MSEDKLEQQFKKIADEFIDLANKHAQKEHVENVSMALLYAASRFNSYVVANNAENLEKYEDDSKTATEFFEAKYSNMLKENLNDYKSVYEPQLKYSHLMDEKKN